MKKDLIVKMTGMLLASSMLMGLAGCDSLKKSSFDDSEVSDVIENYMTLLQKGKYSKAADLVVDGTDYYSDADLSGFQMDILEALLSSTEFEVSDVEGEKEKSAKCTVELEIPDLDDVKHGLDFIDDIADADTFKEEYTIKFVYEDDEWLIKDAGDIADTYIDSLEGYVPETDSEIVPIDLKPSDDEVFVDDNEFSVDVANIVMDEKVYNLENLDKAYVYELALENGEDFTYSEFQDEYGSVIDLIIELVKHTSFSYDLESTDSETYALYTLEGITELIDRDTFNDYIYIYSSDEYAQILADMAFDDFDQSGLYEFYINALIDALNNQTVHDYNTIVVSVEVYLDENGEYACDGIGDFMSELMPDFDALEIDSLDEHPEFQVKIYEKAYDSGYIDETTKNELVASITGSTTTTSSNKAGTVEIEEGSDFSKIEFYTDSYFTTEVDGYKAGDDGVHLLIYTLEDHMADDEFSVVIYANDVLVFEGAGTMGTDNNNVSFIDISGKLVAGEYEVIITGFDGEEFATVHIYT